MLSFRFRPENRLPDTASFQPCFEQPDFRAGTEHFLLLARENQRSLHRLGMVVGKKKARRAADRSRVKRIIRESFRARPQTLAGLDVVVLLRRPLKDLDRRRLRAELDAGWNKLLAKRAQA